MDDGRTLLRHTLATLAYRAAKTLREAPEGFAKFFVIVIIARGRGANAAAGARPHVRPCSIGRCPWRRVRRCNMILRRCTGRRRSTRFFSALERFDACLRRRPTGARRRRVSSRGRSPTRSPMSDVGAAAASVRRSDRSRKLYRCRHRPWSSRLTAPPQRPVDPHGGIPPPLARRRELRAAP